MVPPDSELENPNVTEEVVMLVMSAVSAFEESDSTHTGADIQFFTKFNVQAVTEPPPTVMVPTLSPPVTEGLPVPHDDTDTDEVANPM